MILAFLQNAYSRTEQDAREWEELYASQERQIRRLMHGFSLFAGCRTGRRLRKAFGADTCSDIEWSNASPRIGWKASHKFPADLAHMRAEIDDAKPSVVIGFGRSACDALDLIKAEDKATWVLIKGPHPAARHADVCDRLAAMAAELATAKVAA